MTFRIQTSMSEKGVTYTLSGLLDLEGFAELQKHIERTANGHQITFDLLDIQLVDRNAVSKLAACQSTGVEVRNCPAYVRDWMSREGSKRKSQRSKRK